MMPLRAPSSLRPQTPPHDDPVPSAGSSSAAERSGPDTEADTFEHALHAAILSHDLVQLRRLLQASPALIQLADPPASGLIHMALDANAPAELLATLLSAGASAERLNAQGWTPLHRASAANDVRGVEALLNGNADPRATTPEGTLALQLTSDRQCRRILFDTITMGPSMARLRRHRGPIGFCVWAVGEARRAGYCNLV